MNNGTTTPPGYVLPSRPRWQGGWNVRALLGAVVAFVMAASAASQWLAAQLNNPVEMGDPIVWFHGVAVFQPFAGLVLWKHFAGSRLISSTVRKEIWIAFGATILGGLFLAYLVYWFLSLIRDRKSTDSLMNFTAPQRGPNEMTFRSSVYSMRTMASMSAAGVIQIRRRFTTCSILALSPFCYLLPAEAVRACRRSFPPCASGGKAPSSMT
jgi:hypothetical protein